MARLITTDDVGILQPYIQSGYLNFLIGSGASLPAISLAGNVEGEINDLLENGNEADADIYALAFIQDLEDSHQSLDIGLEDENTENTLKNYVNFVRVVDEILFERKSHLLPRQANIFTTNYDLFIENASAKVPSLILNDGFDRTVSYDGSYTFSPEQFFDRRYRSGLVYSRQTELPTINLFKLHGSLNWRRYNDKIYSSIEKIEKINVEDENLDIEDVKNALENRALILPNLRKFGSALLDRLYYDLLRFYANSLEKENAVLFVFGFSFSDEHLLDITKRSLRNPTSQIIIFCYDQLSAESMEKLFESQRNALIVSPIEGECIGFEKFLELIEGRKSTHEIEDE